MGLPVPFSSIMSIDPEDLPHMPWADVFSHATLTAKTQPFLHSFFAKMAFVFF